MNCRSPTIKREIDSVLCPASFLDSYIDGVRIAFDGNMHSPALEPLRAAFVQFVADSNYFALRDHTAHDPMHQIPDLAMEVLQSLFAEGSLFLSLAKIRAPWSCDICKDTRMVYAKTWIDGEHLGGTCSRCSRRK